MKRKSPDLPIGSLLFAAFLAAGCNLVSLSDPGAVHYSPAQADMLLDEKNAPALWFDFEVDRLAVEKAVRIESSGASVGPAFRWSGNRVELDLCGAEYGRRYVLSASGTLAASDGRSWPLDINVPFFWKARLASAFRVSELTPAAGAHVAPGQELAVAFSSAVDRASLTAGLSLSPSAPWEAGWNADSTRLSLRPRPAWPGPGLLRLSLSDQLKDGQGRAILPMEVLYRVDDGSAPPEVTGATFGLGDLGAGFVELGADLNGIGLDHSIRIVFSTGMDRTSVEGALEWSPSTAVRRIWLSDAELVLVPEAPLVPLTVYRISIASLARSRAGFHLSHDFHASFAPAASFLRLEGLSIPAPAGGSRELGPPWDRYESVPAGLGLDSSATDWSALLQFRFSSRIPVQGQAAAQAALSLSAAFPADLANPVPLSYGWDATGRMLSALYSGFSPSGAGRSCYYRIRLRAGMNGPHDAAGAGLELPLELLVCAQSR